MRPVHFDAQSVLAPFYRHKVLTKEQHLQLCGCSVMTAWRALHAHGYLSSYNFNAKYYTLADIPQFDDQGLWCYRRIGFSRFGSLPRTLSAIVQRSPGGVSAGEVEQLLGITHARTTLAVLAKQGRLLREPLAGLLVYFSAEPARYQQQRTQREQQRQKACEQLPLPEPQRIIAVLVERIQRPHLDARQLARRLAAKGLAIRIQEIEAIFGRYGLEKKTPRTVKVAR